MVSKRGFIGIPILIAIILGIAVLGGGAYLYVHRSPSALAPIEEQPISTTTTTEAGSTFSVSPSSGSAPLTVSFAVSFIGVGHEIDFGDGKDIVSNDNCFAHSPCTATRITEQDSHTYSSPGTYKAVLIQKGGTGEGTVVGTATVTVLGSAPASVSIPGMSKYTDSDFGFSFWYPSGWTVKNLPVSSNDNAVGSLAPGATIAKQLSVGSDSANTITIYEENSPSMTVRGYNHLGSIQYNFNPSLHTWMIANDDNIGDITNSRPADVSANTMGGLHMLWGGSAFVTDIIPLSAEHFLVLSYGGGDSASGVIVNPLAKTIVATDPSIATPVSAAQQTATIQAEKDAYNL